MNIKELLPISSIVLLKEGEKKLMINGVKQTDTSGDGKEYDYLGVLYPKGHIGGQFQFLLNHENMDSIIFRGYEYKEKAEFLTKLAMLYEH